MHGVAGLEAHHRAPAQLGEARPRLGGAEVIRGERGLRDAQRTDVATQRVRSLGDAGGNPRVGRVGGAEAALHLRVEVDAERLRHLHEGDRLTVGPDQHDLVAAAPRASGLLINSEHDGHRPRRPIGQLHGRAHQLVVGRADEAGQGTECTDRDAMDVGLLTAVEHHPRGVVQLRKPAISLLGGQQAVDQRRRSGRRRQGTGGGLLCCHSAVTALEPGDFACTLHLFMNISTVPAARLARHAQGRPGRSTTALCHLPSPHLDLGVASGRLNGLHPCGRVATTNPSTTATGASR